MILGAHTVVNPGTVMIKPFYALVADAAMSRSISPDSLAVWAKQHWVKVLEHSLKTHYSNLLCLQGMKRCQVYLGSQGPL